MCQESSLYSTPDEISTCPAIKTRSVQNDKTTPATQHWIQNTIASSSTSEHHYVTLKEKQDSTIQPQTLTCLSSYDD